MQYEVKNKNVSEKENKFEWNWWVCLQKQFWNSGNTKAIWSHSLSKRGSTFLHGAHTWTTKAND